MSLVPFQILGPLEGCSMMLPIGTSNMILLTGVVFAGSDFTQIWDIDFKRRRVRLWLANVNCLHEIMEKISGIGFLTEFTSAFMQEWKGSS